MVDLHLHTNHSDSSCSLTEVLQKAEEFGYSIISLTDHNTVSAYDELKNTSIRSVFHGKIITGIELNTCYNGEAIEILGYGFDTDKMKRLIPDKYLPADVKRIREYELIKSAYTKAGVRFDESVTDREVYEGKKGAREVFFKEIANHPENEKLYFNKKSLEHGGVFTRYEVYNPESRLYVDESSLYPSIEAVIDMIHKAGGKAFLAHVYEYSKTIAKELQNIVDRYDLDGIECFHNSFSKENSEYLISFCAKNGLFISGGSDYHGTVKPLVSFGCVSVDDKYIEGWVKEHDKL